LEGRCLKYLIPLVIAGQALAYNPTLHQVGINRQQNNHLYTISEQIDISQYECRIGLPYGYQYLTGMEVYFLDNQGLHGPFLVTDYENPEHNQMKDNNLLADIDCVEYVHKKGWLFVKSTSMRY